MNVRVHGQDNEWIKKKLGEFYTDRLFYGKWNKMIEEKYKELTGIKEAVSVLSAQAGIEILIQYFEEKGIRDFVVSGLAWDGTIEYLGKIKSRIHVVDAHIVGMDIYSLQRAVKRLRNEKRKFVVINTWLHGHYDEEQDKAVKEIVEEYGGEMFNDSAHLAGLRLLRTTNHVVSQNTTKVLGAIDQGIILTKEKELEQYARKALRFGWNDNREPEVFGGGYRQNDLNAFLAYKRIEEHLEKEIEKRRRIAKEIEEEIGEFFIPPSSKIKSNWYIADVYVDNRKKLEKELEKRGIETWKTNLHTVVETPIAMKIIKDGRMFLYGELKTTETIVKHAYPVATNWLWGEKEKEYYIKTLKKIMEET